MNDIRLRIELEHERRSHEQTRWWLLGIGMGLLVSMLFNWFLLLRGGA